MHAIRMLDFAVGLKLVKAFFVFIISFNSVLLNVLGSLILKPKTEETHFIVQLDCSL